MIDIAIFEAFRNIFAICPCCGMVFRLSDCHISASGKRRKDWMDKLDDTDSDLNDLEMKICAEAEARREKGRAAGRRALQQEIRRIDPIFTPLKLHANDAKLLGHPVDYVVFDKLKTSETKMPQSIIFVDRQRTAEHELKLQRSIERTIEKGNYDWMVLRVKNDGAIVEE